MCVILLTKDIRRTAVFERPSKFRASGRRLELASRRRVRSTNRTCVGDVERRLESR